MKYQPLVQLEQVSRYYGVTLAVDAMEFEIGRGEVVGFLGPNGAGKSTTMQMIAGTLAPSRGRILIDGIDILDQPRQAKAHLGYLPEQPPLYRELTVDEYLRFCARLNRIPRTERTAAVARAKQRCGLEQVGRRLIGNLSKGYQQRVGIAQAIIHNPSVVILDEPTVGLDPIQIREIRALIRELGNDHSVILSTHILPEVQATCDRVLIINRGRLVYSDSIAGLEQNMRGGRLILGLRRPPPLAELEALPGVEQVERIDAQHLQIHYAAEADPAESLARHAVEQDWGLFELTPQRLSLEDVFVELTCREDDQEAEAA